jgi:hypothetical protein
LNTIKARKEKYPFSYTPSQQGEKLKPQEVVKELNVQAEALGSKYRVFIKADRQRRMSLSLPVLDSIRCGPVNTTDGLSPDHGFLLVVWV